MTDTMPRGRLTLAEVRSHASELAAIAERHGVVNVRVFGSVARGEADELSDLDRLVDVLPGHGLLAVSAFATEVEDMIGVATQVATVKGLKPRVRDRAVAIAVPV